MTPPRRITHCRHEELTRMEKTTLYACKKCYRVFSTSYHDHPRFAPRRTTVLLTLGDLFD